MGKFSSMTKVCGVFILWSAAAIALPAQTFTTVHNFGGTDGAVPRGTLVQSANGSLYGTTSSGGTYGQGTIFKITPQGVQTTVYNFNGTDGADPYAGLTQGTDGNLYGTTISGGTSTACSGGCGTVFRLSGDTLTTLHSFDRTDGIYPEGGVVQGPDGNLWGTTVLGGPPCAISASGCGTAFNISSTGTLTTLYSFTGGKNGALPYSSLVLAKDGDFYGTTSAGAYGEGTIFKLTLKGVVALVHAFCSGGAPCSDGADPTAGMVQDPNGALYGTTLHGGNGSCSINGSVGCGTLFSVTLGGTLTTIHAFDGTDGAGPLAMLVLGNDGNLYGTTQSGGANSSCSGGCGTVFSATLDGAITTLYSFCSQSGCTDGSDPYGGLLQNTNGTFYGTTAYGGANGDGTVFTLSTGLGPFVETLPYYGTVGAIIEILGTDLTGATSVTFNGTTARFETLSYFLIEAQVPTGATNGIVQVVTPTATFLSNVPFKVVTR